MPDCIKHIVKYMIDGGISLGETVEERLNTARILKTIAGDDSICGLRFGTLSPDGHYAFYDKTLIGAVYARDEIQTLYEADRAYAFLLKNMERGNCDFAVRSRRNNWTFLRDDMRVCDPVTGRVIWGRSFGTHPRAGAGFMTAHL